MRSVIQIASEESHVRIPRNDISWVGFVIAMKRKRLWQSIERFYFFICQAVRNISYELKDCRRGRLHYKSDKRVVVPILHLLSKELQHKI